MPNRACAIKDFPGWRCVRGFHGRGPCAMVPRWWNFRARLKFRGWI